MQIQVVTYELAGVSEQQYLTDCNEVAGAIAGLSGLLAKVWLENPELNRYGGLYVWEGRDAMEAGSTWAHPAATDVVSEDYGVLENLTRQTQPLLKVLPD